MTRFDQLIDALYRDMPDIKHIAERVDYFSAKFLNLPYCGNPQGEGDHAEFDQSPLYRFACFDFVTYVNNTLALSFSDNLAYFKKNLLKLNYYDSQAQNENRFHFMSIDWNIQNQKNHFLKDVTKTIGESELAIGIIDKPNWFLKRDQNDIKPFKKTIDDKKIIALKNLSKLFKAELASLAYLPTQKVLEHNTLKKIPHGAIIEIVRPNWDLVEKIGTHIHVSHIGFAIYKNNALYFRHASSEHQKTEEVLMENYLKNTLKNPLIKGINIQIALASR